MKLFNRIIAVILIALAGLEVFVYASNANFDLFGNSDREEITIVHVPWEDGISASYVIENVLEEAGYDVTLTQVDIAILFESIATGEADATVSPWLPSSHGALMDQYEDQLVDLGPNAENNRNGLAVPTYMEVDSIEDLTDESNQTIVGVEPGAGINDMAREALEVYPNLADWELSESSSGAMYTLLDQSIQNQESIVVTGWQPHWKFMRYDLKFLDDPELAFGEEESVHTLTREGFSEEHPEANQILDNFYWTVEDIGQVMNELSQGVDPEIAAQNWIDQNPDRVAEWTEGVFE